MRAPTEYHKTIFLLIENRQQSEPNQKTFCEQQRIVPNGFYYWYNCYRAQNDVAVI